MPGYLSYGGRMFTAHKEKGRRFSVAQGDALAEFCEVSRVFMHLGCRRLCCWFDSQRNWATSIPKYVLWLKARFADCFWPAIEQHVECTHTTCPGADEVVPNNSTSGFGRIYPVVSIIRKNLEGALSYLPGARIVHPSFADDAASCSAPACDQGFTLFWDQGSV